MGRAQAGVQIQVAMKHVDDEAAALAREIGARLRYARKARGMSQSALGAAIGVSFQQVQKYELGTNRLSASALVLVARVLNVSPRELLGIDAPASEPAQWDLSALVGAEALLRSYNDISSPKLRRTLRRLALWLSETDPCCEGEAGQQQSEASSFLVRPVALLATGVPDGRLRRQDD
jgi:transcriptional regulator with XRE-family HTH domain